MIIVRLIGGLGNQMFQYACGRSLSQKNNAELKLDVTGFDSYKLHRYSLDAFNIKKEVASEKEIERFKNYKIRSGRRWFLYNKLIADGSKYFQEKGFDFDPDVLELQGDAYLDGYWQSAKYFKEIGSTIRSDFSFVLPQGEKDKEISALINACTAVSIHIRRADYVTNTTTNKTHGTCSIEYYNQAIELLAEKVSSPCFFVFSDDHEWVKQNLKSTYPMVYVEHNGADTNYQDLRLMTSCKHNIIANSSFSWWGAWLNANPNKIVIAPKKWFANAIRNEDDIIPSTWSRL